ncbi:uncharacterized protein LOC143202235 isoform X2 [Rhynchophorus ferrugineus]|uniref:uncharacterized protein LOC143202235 isoform X2 n=1 Tax=Rhynchophorus ferrugineus TaxID=354439 RepID=UPI003FCCE011
MFKINLIKICIFVIKRKVLLLFVISVIMTLLFFWFHYTLINDIDRKARLEKINKVIKTQASSLACKQPVLPVYAPEIMKFIVDVPPIDCSKAGIDWVKCRGSECVIQEEAKIKYGPIKCSFTDILRVNDYTLSDGETFYSSEYYKLERSDVVRVSCKSAEFKWSGILTGIRIDNNIWDKTNWEEMPSNSLKMNVLMFGFDSLSHNAFIRKLPKSYDYLTKMLDAILLKGYNIIGDGTPQALIPLLTGKTELELPDTRKRLKDTEFVDVYPFIWNDFKDNGYVTAFLEDLADLGTFTYRLNGFKEIPTDHYMRTYYLANSAKNSIPKYCDGETPSHKVMFNIIRDFFTVYQTKPKFLFGFHGELSHDDYNLIGAADDDLLQLLTELNISGSLNNTVLIIMADHGHRFADVRNTIQGKQEERLPFFSFSFPQWFKKVHSHIYNNFKSNEDKLVTPFDIHLTLKDIIDLKHTHVADISQRAVSLFSKIPAERSCSHAYIEPHWCACLDWIHVDISDKIVHRLGATLMDTINNLTSVYRDICASLSISSIIWVTKLGPNSNLLKFSRNADIDGFVADLSATMDIKTDLYQIKALVIPGNSLFEASITHHKSSNTLDVKISDISRINMYGKQAKCVEKTLPFLRKFCFCKN